jgi:RNA polymerase sigma-70 factor (ECF subfamily)
MPPGLETAWEVFEVRAALDRLPDAERVVVQLSHLEGLTHVEIADRLGIPVGTVKSRSHRAHQRLATLLSHVNEI